MRGETWRIRGRPGGESLLNVAWCMEEEALPEQPVCMGGGSST